MKQKERFRENFQNPPTLVVGSFKRTIHAKTEAIAFAARRGVMTGGATCYCKMTPCRNCAMVLIQAGIKRVVCEKHYHAEAESVEMFKQVGMEIEWVEDCVEGYE